MASGNERAYSDVRAERTVATQARDEAEEKVMDRDRRANKTAMRAERRRELAAEMAEDAAKAQLKAEVLKRKADTARDKLRDKRMRVTALEHECFEHSVEKRQRALVSQHALHDLYAAGTQVRSSYVLEQHLKGAHARGADKPYSHDIPRLLREYAETQGFTLVFTRATSTASDHTQSTLKIELHSPQRHISVTHSIVTGQEFIATSQLSVQANREFLVSAYVNFPSNSGPNGNPTFVYPTPSKPVPTETRAVVPETGDPKCEHSRFLHFLLLGFPYNALLPGGQLEKALTTSGVLRICQTPDCPDYSVPVVPPDDVPDEVPVEVPVEAPVAAPQ